MAKVVALPDLSSRPFRLISERAMLASPEALFRAWTESSRSWVDSAHSHRRQAIREYSVCRESGI
jgi:hypothetical protein